MLSPDSWFSVRPLDEGVWAISDHGHSLMYLVSGTEGAVLIDTGWGVGDLPVLVRSLTPLPLEVVHTHGHPDHCSGDGAFGRVRLHEADRFLVQPLPNRERAWVVETMLSRRLPREIDLGDWNPAPALVMDGLEAGEVIDLGGRSLAVIGLPGHSPGSVCLLEMPAGRLYTGDSVLPRVWAHLEESAPLSVFLDGLRRLRERRADFSGLFPGHGSLRRLPEPLGVLDDLTAGIVKIAAGELQGVPESNFAGDGLRCDFGKSGVIYRPDRV